MSKTLYPLDVHQLTKLLTDAKDAHTIHEKVSGPDPNWPKWYADYMIKRLELENGSHTNLCALTDLDWSAIGQAQAQAFTESPFPPYAQPHDIETVTGYQSELGRGYLDSSESDVYDRLEADRNEDEDPTL